MNPISGYIKLALSLVIAAAIGLAFYKTYEFGYRNAQAVGNSQLAQYKDSIDHAQAANAQDAFAKYAKGVQSGQAAEAQFFTTTQAESTQAAAIKGQIDAVAQPHIPVTLVSSLSSGASTEPVYRCVFSRGFVRLWNAATGATDDSGSAVPAGSDSSGPALGAGSDEAADSGVSQADILDWLVDFANIKRTDENKLKAIRSLEQPASDPVASAVAPTN